MALRRALPLALAVLAACKNPQPCPTPLEECDGSCVDVQSDRRYCGSCGIACRAGETCTAGGCRVDARGPCPQRVGGGFVTLGFPNDVAQSCAGQVVKVWVTQATFLDDAVAQVGSTTLARIPVLDVVGGADCDEQWSWHTDDLTPAFVTTVTPPTCAACPSVIQANVPGYVQTVRRWCPAAARILAVDRRPVP
jgi:hypothetical protein